MNKQEVYDYIRARRHAVLSTAGTRGEPEAALIGIAVTPELEIVFDTIETTRKCANLRRNPRVALVIGWDGEQTLQYEGTADRPGGGELEDLKRIYCAVWPNAPTRDIWPGHVYFRVRPKWLRFSSYEAPYRVDELSL